jgi:two-component system, NtrC family, sensor kinase
MPPSVSSPLPSLRTELLATFAVLALAALVFAVASVVLLYDAADPARAALYICLLIAADVVVVVAFGAHKLRQLVLLPLRAAAAAAEAIADGDLRRRMDGQQSRELQQLAASVNRMTERLLHEQAQLIRAEKLASVGRLAAGVAHEIGNPLGALNGYAHLLRTTTAKDAAAREAVSGVERETARIDRIVRGLLDYARPRRPIPTPIDINDTLRRVVDLLSAQGLLRRVSLIMELANEGPFVHGEQHEMEQVFVNLLLNAADAVNQTGVIAIRTTCMPSDTLEHGATRRASDSRLTLVPHPPSPRVQHWLGSDHRPSWVVKIVVADSGPGVDDEHAEHIFDPFYTTKEPGKGTGLGLAIVARVVENLEGIVWVQRAREGGAAFHLLFPLAEASFALDDPAVIPREWQA